MVGCLDNDTIPVAISTSQFTSFTSSGSQVETGWLLFALWTFKAALSNVKVMTQGLWCNLEG